ncbi:MAG: Gfo/Idh/MocA family oxidoreductase [Bacteroidales bacterium]|nr:Gfo/Idh/MocA family oxidoreductase [Bacteroidales bacterium]
MVRVGIIGCGKIAQVRHIPEYVDNPDAQIVALYDTNAARAAGLAGALHAKAYATLDELLADPGIDAVSVCVANNAHCEVTVKALEAGKHVLCEKPMATTIEECETMVKCAERCGRILMIGQNQRLARAHVKARELIAGGAIGKVITFRTTFGHSGPENWSVDPGRNTWFFDRSKAAFGVMADLGIHKTDLIQYLIGQNVIASTSRLLTLDKTDANGNPISLDDNSFCIYEMSGGATGTMTASWTYYGEEDNSTVIYGTEGIMRIYDVAGHSIVINHAEGGKTMMDLEAIQTNDNQTKSGIIDAFVDCLVRDVEPLIPAKGVLAAMRAVFASIKSSEEGRRIVIPENNL